MGESTVHCEQTGRAIAPHETAFVVEGRVVCREAHDALRPACPYCRGELPAKPAPYSNCPYCKQTIYIRTSQDIFDSTLVTREQAEVADRIEDLVRPLRPYGIRMRDFVALRDKLAADTHAPPGEDDVVWQLHLEAARRNPEPALQAQVLLLQARFLHAHGKDHRTIHRHWGQAALRALAAAGCTHVRIVGLPGECVASRRLHDTVRTLEQARADLSLPCVDCNRRPVAHEMVSRAGTPKGLHARQLVGRLPFCDCHYEPADAPGHEHTPTAAAPKQATPQRPTAQSDPGADLLANLDL